MFQEPLPHNSVTLPLKITWSINKGVEILLENTDLVTLHQFITSLGAPTLLKVLIPTLLRWQAVM